VIVFLTPTQGTKTLPCCCSVLLWYWLGDVLFDSIDSALARMHIHHGIAIGGGERDIGQCGVTFGVRVSVGLPWVLSHSQLG